MDRISVGDLPVTAHHPQAAPRPADESRHGQLRLLRLVERPDTAPLLRLAGYKTGYQRGRADERLVSALWMTAIGLSGLLIGCTVGLMVRIDALAWWLR